MDSAGVARIVGSDMTVSDKIRALNAAGYPRADIARVLGKRYQHVRNVLESDKAHGVRSAMRAPAIAPGVQELPQSFAGIHRLFVEPDGRLRLPAEVGSALGLRVGGILVGELVEDRFVLMSAEAAARKAQALIAGSGRGTDRILSEELMAERRAETARGG
jgi:hypothetical protein